MSVWRNVENFCGRPQPIKDSTSRRSRGRARDTCGSKARGTCGHGLEDLAYSAVASNDEYAAAVCRLQGRQAVFARTFDHVPRMPGVFCHLDLVRYAPLVEQGFNLVCKYACVRM